MPAPWVLETLGVGPGGAVARQVGAEAWTQGEHKHEEGLLGHRLGKGMFFKREFLVWAFALTCTSQR